MVVGNHQCNPANRNQSKPQFQFELSLAQFSPSLLTLVLFILKLVNEDIMHNRQKNILPPKNVVTGKNLPYACNGLQ